MATHPFVLLVEPNPLLRGLISGELKDHGCVVFHAADGSEALRFAALYPGAIDLAVADTSDEAQTDREFVRALRALPTGARTNVLQLNSAPHDAPPGSSTALGQSCLMKPFDRTSLLRAVWQALSPARPTTTQPDRAVFWGSRPDADGDLDVAV